MDSGKVWLLCPRRPSRPSSRRGDEPLDGSPQWGWSDEIEAPPADWWLGEEHAWEAPELALDEERILLLDADEPFSADEWPGYAASDW